MNISVIIPAYNEAGVIAETVKEVRSRGDKSVLEIIVVDGGSDDGTLEEAAKAGAKKLQSPRKGRASQMNYGAERARGSLLYFLHADSHPPAHFTATIQKAAQTEYDAGCFRLAFDDNCWLLRVYAWFTRFNIDLFRFGDQSLFITRSAFFRVGAFREDHSVMEDQEMVRRIKRSSSFAVLDGTVTTSARKYRKTGVIKLQLVFGLILVLYYLGIGQDRLVVLYKRLIQ